MKLSRLLALFLFVFAPCAFTLNLGYTGLSPRRTWADRITMVRLYGGTFGGYLASGRLAILSVGMTFAIICRSNGASFDTGSIGLV